MFYNINTDATLVQPCPLVAWRCPLVPMDLELSDSPLQETRPSSIIPGQCVQLQLQSVFLGSLPSSHTGSLLLADHADTVPTPGHLNVSSSWMNTVLECSSLSCQLTFLDLGDLPSTPYLPQHFFHSQLHTPSSPIINWHMSLLCCFLPLNADPMRAGMTPLYISSAYPVFGT